MSSELRISYEIRIGDLQALLERNEQVRQRSRSRMRFLPNALVQASLWALVVYVFGFGSSHRLLSAAVGACVGGLWFVVLPGQVRRLVLQRIRKRLAEPGNRFLLGPRTLDIEAERFAIVGPDGESRVNWPALQNVVETPERIFLYVTGFTAHVIPVPEADRTTLMAELRRRAPAAFAGRA